jgi:hypothetical protein
MFNLTNQRPGVPANSCIKVIYSGSLSATVKLYSTVTGTLGPYVNLVVTRGTDSTPSFSGCSGFTADPTNYIGLGSGVLYSGTLAGYPSAYASGLNDPNPAWTSGSSSSYQFSVSIANNDAAQGLSASAGFTWEARS